MLAGGLFLELSDLVEACDCRHKAEERVHSHGHTLLAHEHRGLVAVEHL